VDCFVMYWGHLCLKSMPFGLFLVYHWYFAIVSMEM
jgi:hypothetical protein